MRLVGPRPLLSEYLKLYNKRQNRRHEVTPGISGWAQVNGRNAISWEKSLNMIYIILIISHFYWI
jgi:lipopolysaccharide/colanic/teichoic acid biosynthesis glycosyltransferase